MIGHVRLWTAAIGMLVSVGCVAGEPKVIMLDVQGMSCEVCPLTVSRAIKRVGGIVAVETKYEGNGNGWAKVSYDPAKAKVEAIVAATAQVGYPSQIRKK